MELTLLAVVIVLSLLLALGGTRAILGVVLLLVIRTAPAPSIGHIIPGPDVLETHPTVPTPD
ncbi:MAG TPA: hypothetical protein VI485_03585 [Vicinamibacterales bacterium]|nr:hypothetical protein [Vicinamibacterales bacterium]